MLAAVIVCAVVTGADISLARGATVEESHRCIAMTETGLPVLNVPNPWDVEVTSPERSVYLVCLGAIFSP